jgi:Cu/Ag efflux protein CusF
MVIHDQLENTNDPQIIMVFIVNSSKVLRRLGSICSID